MPTEPNEPVEEVEEGEERCEECAGDPEDCRCSACRGCSGHCDCWMCEGCDLTYRSDRYLPCEHCNTCCNCCDCYSCDRCGCTRTASERDRLGWCCDCARCVNCCRCRPAGMYDYGHKPRPIFFPGMTFKQPKEVCYGVELEVNYNTLDSKEDVTMAVVERIGSHAYLKEDGSLHSGGFEIVTHPHTFKAMVKFWKQYFAEGVPRGVSAYRSGECGMHVHMSRAIIGEPTIRKMVAFLNDPYNNRFVEMVAQRGSSVYAAANASKAKLTQYLNTDGNRYELLNITNEHTVEVRIFRASYRLDRVLKNLEFCKALAEFCGVQGYGGLKYTRFATWILQRRKSYPNLVKYVEERGGWLQGKLADSTHVEVEECA